MSNPFPRLARATAALLFAFGPPAWAGPPGASDWAPGHRAAFRLVDGGPGDAPGRRMAGVEIRMDPNFKTYWRMPGDSGLPPSFSWDRSENVEAVEVRWPAPKRFQDAAGSSIGYKGHALLPLRVTLKDPGKPATLDLKLDYAVCEQICIPVSGEARLTLGGPLAPFAASVREAEARTPAAASLGEGPVPAVASLAAAPDDTALLATTLTPADAAETDVFVEGPDGDWLFGAPSLVSEERRGDQRRAVWRLAVDARPTGAKLAGQTVTVTLTADERAVEVSSRLDAEVKPH